MSAAIRIIKNKWLVRLYALVVIIVVWQIVGQSVTPIVFAPPIRVAKTFLSLWSEGTLPADTIVTLEAVFGGFVISCAIGIPLGLIMGRIRSAEYAVDPYVNFIYATPVVALLPIALIWFGPSVAATYFITTLHSAPPILINTMTGVKNTEKTIVETGRSFGFKGWKLWQKVVIPASLPYVMAGLRIGIGAALIGTMVAEIFLYNVGLGYLLTDETALFNSAAVLAGVLVIMAIGIGLTEFAKWIDRRFLYWAAATS